MTRLPPAPDLDWTEGGAPRALAVDDVYFSRNGGLEESRAVFLHGCGLPERWAGARCFVIGELGFGAGLNALAAWDLWRATRAPGAVLHFVSVEGFPLDRVDAARALAPFHDVAALAQRLLARWPVRARGGQRLWFPEDGFALTVIHAPVAEALSGFVGAVDAWFLDGFSPARNPEMWDDALMARIGALSAPGARLATYSVAGAVRRALTAAGFAVEKKPGFSGKRARLEATFTAPHAAAPMQLPYCSADTTRVAILGAGIAGASVAAALHRRGIAHEVYDATPGASGNPVALVAPRLDRTDTGVARLFRAAHLEALACYTALGAFDAIGVVERPRNGAEAAALADLIADPPFPESHFRAVDGGVLHAQAGIVRPRIALDAMLAGAVRRRDVTVASLERAGALWVLRDGEGRVVGEATAVVIASGAGLAALAQTRWTPLEYSRGQLEWGALRGGGAGARA